MDRWLKVTITISPDHLDELVAALSACGQDALEIEDPREYDGFIESIRPSWQEIDEELARRMRQNSSVSFYIAEDAAAPAVIEGVRLSVDGLLREGSGRMSTQSLSEEDWSEAWKRYYLPLPIGQKILIQPAWLPVEEKYAGRAVFRNNPGMSFGTGEHPTTRLCLEELDGAVRPGMTVLDLGSGSGILSVVAALLGAGKVTGVDIDPMACDIARRNAAENGLSQGIFTAISGDILNEKPLLSALSEQKCDLLLSNIVADVIIALSPMAPALLAEGGVWVASGIIEPRADEVRAAVRQDGWEIIRERVQDGWVLLAMRRI